MNSFIKQLMVSLVGRRAVYRIGRSLYQKARGDVANDMKSNGEMLIQKCVVSAWKNSSFSEQRLVVFDVGANVGDWSNALVERLSTTAMHETADLYIFEPVPSTFDFLKKRLGSDNSALHYENVALSSENGESTIYVSAPNAGTNSLHASSQSGEQEQISIVKVTAADFCSTNNIQKIHLLKCDTEGHDMEVIRGALPLLTEEKISILQFEYNHRWIYARNYLRDVFIVIEKLPYKLVMLQPDHLWVFSEWHPELERFFEANYALVHEDALDWFPTKCISWDNYNTMCVEEQ
jgi:FkbM family methyltransferase